MRVYESQYLGRNAISDREKFFEEKKMEHNFTPKQIVAELNRYIVGQDEAKKMLAIALRNRWRAKQLPEEVRDEYVPKNILLIGPTGVGKTELARRLAKLVKAPFLKVEATKFTEVGYVGRDVDSMVRDLVENAVRLVKSEQLERQKEKAEQLANMRLLELLWPKKKSEKAPVNPLDLLFKDKEDTQNTEEPTDQDSEKRKAFFEQLVNGLMDSREIEIEVEEQSQGFTGILTGNSPDEINNNFQDMINSIMPKRKKKRRTTVREARKIFAQEEGQKLVDMDNVVDEALALAEQEGIIFIDEFDKVASSGQGTRGPDVSREGVQRDILPIVEGATVNTKYGMVKTDHILFIAAGAFHVSKPSDLIPELQGRFPIRVELSSLSKDDFKNILTTPKQALLKQYHMLLKADGVTVQFTEEAIDKISEIAYRVNTETENIGARRLHTILEKLLQDISFNAPADSEVEITITATMVEDRLNSIVENVDVSRYIL